MDRKLRKPLMALPAALFMAVLVGCEAQKSSNPLSPSVAGPIAGVEISAPRMLEPSENQRFRESQQPIRLLVENASSNGVRPLYYSFEVASDTDFQTKMFARSQVPPGGEGRTNVQLDRLELGRTYYWRARAEDGANTGPYLTARFEVLPRAQLGPPPTLSPINNERIGSRRVTLTAGAADRNAAIGALFLEFQLARDPGFGQVVAAAEVAESGGQTTYSPDIDLAANLQHYWRVRATDRETTSAWAGVQGFITPPAAGPAPGPSPGPAPGGPCISSSPSAIVECERAKFGHMSSSQLVSFLRSVARSMNASGIGSGPFGILRKGDGHNCGGYSCDVICSGQGGGQRQWDVLSDADGAQNPVFSGPLPAIRVDVCEIQ